MANYGGDMIANLMHLPEAPALPEGIRIKHAFAGDKREILTFVQQHFRQCWVDETEFALMQKPIQCFVATDRGRLLGFACYDVSAKGFFGPIGVLDETRGNHVGAALLIRTLEAMREAGYAYAVIGWVDEAIAPFYEKTVHAKYIDGGEPENSIYGNYISML